VKALLLRLLGLFKAHESRRGERQRPYLAPLASKIAGVAHLVHRAAAEPDAAVRDASLRLAVKRLVYLSAYMDGLAVSERAT
jgi:hypothetical protein